MGSAFLLAIALSLDGFGVGLAYGLRRIHLPPGALSVIALCTIVAMGSSMLIGRWMVSWVELVPWKAIGAGLIVLLGLVQIMRAFHHQRDWAGSVEAVPALAGQPVDRPSEPETVLHFQVRFLGLVIQVLRTPHLADVDGSGRISLRESILLGLALAMDAFATGVGAAMAGITFVVILLVSIIQVGMIKLGQALAGKIPERLLLKAEFLPGMVLIAIGLGKLV